VKNGKTREGFSLGLYVPDLEDIVHKDNLTRIYIIVRQRGSIRTINGMHISNPRCQLKANPYFVLGWCFVPVLSCQFYIIVKGGFTNFDNLGTSTIPINRHGKGGRCQSLHGNGILPSLPIKAFQVFYKLRTQIFIYVPGQVEMKSTCVFVSKNRGNKSSKEMNNTK